MLAVEPQTSHAVYLQGWLLMIDQMPDARKIPNSNCFYQACKEGYQFLLEHRSEPDEIRLEIEERRARINEGVASGERRMYPGTSVRQFQEGFINALSTILAVYAHPQDQSPFPAEPPRLYTEVLKPRLEAQLVSTSELNRWESRASMAVRDAMEYECSLFGLTFSAEQQETVVKAREGEQGVVMDHWLQSKKRIIQEIKVAQTHI